MKDEEAKQFYDRMKTYALKRKAPRWVAEEFPAYAWEKWYVQNWRTDIKKVWMNFVRDDLGPYGGPKNRVLSSIRSRKKYWGEDMRKDFLENAVAAPLVETMIQLKSLSTSNQMICCLIQCGFEVREIYDAFFSNVLSYESFRIYLQQSLLKEKHFEGRDLLSISKSDIRFEEALKKKKMRSSEWDQKIYEALA